MNKKIAIASAIVLSVVLLGVIIYLFVNKDNTSFNNYITNDEELFDDIIPNDITPDEDEFSIVSKFVEANGIVGTFQYVTSPDWMPDLWEVFSSGYDRCFLYYDSASDKTTVIVLDGNQPRIFQIL